MRKFLATWWILSAMGHNDGEWPDGAETALCRVALWDPTSKVVHRYISKCVEVMQNLQHKVSGKKLDFKAICDRAPSHLARRIEQVPSDEDLKKSAEFREFKLGRKNQDEDEQRVLLDYRRAYSEALHINVSGVIRDLPVPGPAEDVPLETLIADVTEKRTWQTRKCGTCGITLCRVTGAHTYGGHVCRVAAITHRCTQCPRTFHDADLESESNRGSAAEMHFCTVHVKLGSERPAADLMERPRIFSHVSPPFRT
eukprot:TRINITY_DN5764_c0_g1_i1.p1 TRINITY_DN5764_c0_g1~~TRINITY_DN5764_c0_g1_i1.p1  ORF type:complete len:255 (-),score=22.96 TRINITY_DN5764_c0_g1_i1:545-1309(-)